MPTYQITDPQTGKKLKVTGDTPPTSAELEQLFSATTRQAVPAHPPDSALSRGASALWDQINPVAAVKGVMDAVRHPISTVEAIGQAQGVPFTNAQDAYAQGDYVGAAAHGLNYLLPVLGPALDQQVVKAKHGDIAGSVGGTLGIAANLVGPQAAKEVVGLIPQASREALAAKLTSGATSRVADVMAPKLGANKYRLGNVAEKVAPKIAAEEGLNAFSREGLHAKIAAKLDEASAQLDAAANARNAKQVYNTGPIIQDLVKARARLTANGTAIPTPNLPRANAITQAIEDVQKLGPLASYESIRRIRQAWDIPAKAVYSPAMTSDYMVKMGEKLGAADVTGALRERLAGFDPTTAEANARYALFKSADDVLTATAEIERSRPKVGRQMVARAAGTTTGGMLGGGFGAVSGYFIGPAIDAAMHSGATTQIATARLMTQLAAAVRSGSVARTQGIVNQLTRMTAAAMRANQALKPAGMPVGLPALAPAATDIPQTDTPLAP